MPVGAWELIITSLSDAEESGGSMKHFVTFIVVIFTGLFLAMLNKTEKLAKDVNKPVLRVFGYSSFTSKWGAGPQLKALFEKSCNCTVEFIEGSDAGILLQRLKIEGESLGADLIIGLDQYDLSKALSEQKWKSLKLEGFEFYEQIAPLVGSTPFVPFDWGVLTFIAKKKDEALLPKNLDDLLRPQYTKKISLQDPRTSSPGMQFLSWIYRQKKGAEADAYLQQIMGQAHSFAPSWSASYGFFSQGQTELVFSYVTSPLYHQLEEKKDDFIALNFEEPHPVQIEYLGVPDFCRNCELAESFVSLILSADGQKIIMEKNYMFPVVKGVLEGTPFDILSQWKTHSPESIPKNSEAEALIKKWVDIRRGDLN